MEAYLLLLLLLLYCCCCARMMLSVRSLLSFGIIAVAVQEVWTVEMLSSRIRPGLFRHVTCRNNVYPRSSVRRSPVPDDQVFWSTAFPGYAPPSYTAPHINGQIWADKELLSPDFAPQWQQVDGAVNRRSFTGAYDIREGYPLNPIGRTGLAGRGLLGRWGPNHAADPVVTRWKRDDAGDVVRHAATQKQILQMIAVQRHDNRMWAIPGGMVDPGEKVSQTLKREFMEEALNGFESQRAIEEFFANGTEIYKGYVDDFRNTDNAWMETVAFNFHDETGTQVGRLRLAAGDDAANVRWTDIDGRLRLHANHIDIVEEVAKRRDCHW